MFSGIICLVWLLFALTYGLSVVNLWAAPYCMAVVVSHFWFGHRFSLSLCFDDYFFGRFVPDLSFGA